MPASLAGGPFRAGIKNGGPLGPPSMGMCRLAPDLALQALLEALDLASRVDDRLLAREERVAVATHVDTQLRSGRADRPLGPAGTAMDLGFVVGGMDIGLHDVLSSDAVRAGQWPSRWSPITPGLFLDFGARGGRLDRLDPDALLGLGCVFELHLAGDGREHGVIMAQPGPGTGQERHATLTDDDRAGMHQLAVAGLDAQALAAAVAAVLEPPAPLLVG